MNFTSEELKYLDRLLSCAIPQKSKFRVTLEFDVFDDFDPYNINWDKLFDIEGQESLSVHVEDLTDDW